MNKKFKEQRKHVRYKTKLPIRISDPKSDSISTQTINISVEGAYCKVPRFISPMTKMMVKVVVPLDQERGKSTDEAFQCEAIVVYINPKAEKDDVDSYEIGLWFSNLKDKDRKKIQLYVKQHLDKLNDEKLKS